MLKGLSSLVAVAAMLAGPGQVLAKDHSAPGSAFDFEFQSIDGTPMPLAGFKGRVLLVVNTASFCGYTRQYEALQALWAKYEPRGLVVIGVPSNDFGGQEPKAEGEIASFCKGAFGVTFPLTSKTQVVGAGAHPFYAWAMRTLGPSASPGWNFHKYLVGRDGRLIASFSTAKSPNSDDIIAAIEAALAKTADGT